MSKAESDFLKDNNSVTTKARTWVAVLWLENIREDWQSKVEMLLQNPFVYCIHDKDFESDGTPRKPHVHLMVSFPNTTTYKAALSRFRAFSAPGRSCCNTCYAVFNIRYMYEYLIHNTDLAKKENKHLYDRSERVEGCNFDIGFLEQLSVIDKKQMLRELSMLVINERITNYADLYMLVVQRYDLSYLDIVYGYSGHLERLTRGIYLKEKAAAEAAKEH